MVDALAERVDAYRAVRVQRTLLEQQMRRLQFALCQTERRERALARDLTDGNEATAADAEVRQWQAEADAELVRRGTKRRRAA